MKRLLPACLILVYVFGVQGISQVLTPNQPAGGAPPYASIPTAPRELPQVLRAAGVPSSPQQTFTTTVFTFNDIIIFSYFEGTSLEVFDSFGTMIASQTLNADELMSISPGSGIYRIEGNKSYTVLIGDPITNYVNGYFAVDEAGRGTSTKLNTWMMAAFNSVSFDHFVIFAYENGTEFTVRNLTSGQLILASTLNAGQYYDFPNANIPYSSFIQVTSSKPVSVLSYTDQDYYVPSSNGTFAGTLFYGFSGYIGGWSNSITVTGYEDNTSVTVTDIATGNLISSYMLNAGQVHTDTITTDTFWKVQSDKTVTAANIPYAGWTGNYAYLARSIDQTGRGAGTLFYVPTIASEIHVFSFDDANSVTITELGQLSDYPYPNPQAVFSGTLNAGEGYAFFSPYGNYVYKVEGTGNVSVVQSSGGFGADFMPLGFALLLPDLSISSDDIDFDPPDSVYVAGDRILISIRVHNTGVVTASNIVVTAYDGDPEGGGIAPPIGTRTIPSLAPNSTATVEIDYLVPSDPEFHTVVVKVDPGDIVVESNNSNNKASRPLKPNQDLLPPLATTIVAPAGLTINPSTGQLSPNPFTVEAFLFNTGTVSAMNVRATLSLQNGLTPDSGTAQVLLGNMAASASGTAKWKVMANPAVSGINLYSIRVEADNAEPKDVNRAINVPDATAPAAPSNLQADNGQIPGSIILSWSPNAEADLAGYKIYYGTGPTGYAGTGATEGDSPITVSAVSSFVVTGLQDGVAYRFALKAFDTSTNESDFSNEVSITATAVIEEKLPGIPDDYALSQNFPNPFNPETEIEFSLPAATYVTLRVFNVLGEEVKVLVEGERDAGRYRVRWDGTNRLGRQVSSGLYLYRFTGRGLSGEGDEYFELRKMVLTR